MACTQISLTCFDVGGSLLKIFKGKLRILPLITILLDFSLTVKAATLIFISGRGSAISSAKEGKSGFIYNMVKSLISFLSRANVRAFDEHPNRIHTELTFINPLSA